MNDIDKALDAMTETELVAVEQELDKKAVEVSAEYHFAVGVKMAREAVEHFKKTGELTDAMAIVLSKTAKDDDKGTHPIARAITSPLLAGGLGAPLNGEENIAKGKAASDITKKFKAMGETEKTAGALLARLGSTIGKGLVGFGLKGTTQGLGQGLARRAGMTMLQNPRTTGLLAAGAGGLAVGSIMGNKDKDK